MDLKAKLDKKSVIQIAILVILVAAGAAAYIVNQEDGLGFISDLLPGMEKKVEAPAPVAPPKPAEPPIPAQPAKGEIAGKPFEPEAVVLEGGVLAFVQSKEPQSAVLIRLAHPKWETPAGKKFKYAPAAANAPVVTASRMDGGEMKRQTFADKYTLVVEFGAEKDRKLPGKLSLSIAGDPKTMLAGTFAAEIKGFRIVDGKPDLTSDSTDTLEYLALAELLKDDPDKKMEIVAFRDQRYTADPAEKNRVGYLEVEYRGAQTQTDIRRFQFVKSTEWKVRSPALTPDQVDEAHPLVAPGPKDKPEQVLVYLAARQLEASERKKKLKKGIYGASFVTRHSAKTKLGVTEASYKLDPGGQIVKTAYLFRLKQGGWTFDHELGAKEKINLEAGK